MKYSLEQLCGKWLGSVPTNKAGKELGTFSVNYRYPCIQISVSKSTHKFLDIIHGSHFSCIWYKLAKFWTIMSAHLTIVSYKNSIYCFYYDDVKFPVCLKCSKYISFCATSCLCSWRNCLYLQLMAVLPITVCWGDMLKSLRNKKIVQPIRGKASLQNLRMEGLVPEKQTPQQYRQWFKIDEVIWNSEENKYNSRMWN